ncbi:MAG: hypothetical protein LBL82_05625 [Oscillospiraceae bacterium]|jgi:hypothetical protein|nr:hypothetical protein [Oscillospiraceae bacterium]
MPTYTCRKCNCTDEVTNNKTAEKKTISTRIQICVRNSRRVGSFYDDGYEASSSCHDCDFVIEKYDSYENETSYQCGRPCEDSKVNEIYYKCPICGTESLLFKDYDLV